MDYADRKRMPVDESKMRDILRNQGTIRNKMDEEIGTYKSMDRNSQFENGVLTYLNEATYGEMRDLVRDVGVNSDELEFYNVTDL
jgi:hypothetical protein